MLNLKTLLKSAWPVALTTCLAVDVIASEPVGSSVASAPKYASPAANWRARAAAPTTPPWLRMPPAAMRAPAGMAFPPQITRAAAVPAWRMPPPPAPYWARSYRQPPTLARYYPRPAAPQVAQTQRTPSVAPRFAQYRPPMPSPAPYWVRNYRQPPALARYYPRPAAPQAAQTQRTASVAPRFAQYRPPMPSRWTRTQRPFTNWVSSAADSRQLQTHIEADSVAAQEAPRVTTAATASNETPQMQSGDTRNREAETAELAAFESSPKDAADRSLLKVESDAAAHSNEQPDLGMLAPLSEDAQALPTVSSETGDTAESIETVKSQESPVETGVTADDAVNQQDEENS
jgi:hypothetical protein